MIYQTIKDLCKKKGTTINKLEHELSISRGSLCRIDINKPSIEKLRKIADYFGVTVDYLMTGNDGEKKEKDSDISAVELDVAKDIDRLIIQMGKSKESKLTYGGIELSDVEVELFRKDLIAALDRLREYNRLINSNSEKK